MKTKIARVLLALSLAALPAVNAARADDAKGSATAASASGSASDEASKRFRSGVAFFKSKDFSAAMVEFKRAYELVPNYSVLYNLGQTARELKDYALALTAYERYLREGDTKIQAARRKEVTTAIEELRGKVGKIKVVTNVSGAEIAVDDITVGASPLPESVVVNIGRRKVSATPRGYAPAQRVLDVAGQEEATATLELTKIGAAVPSQTTPSPAPTRPSPSVLAAASPVPVTTAMPRGRERARAAAGVRCPAMALPSRIGGNCVDERPQALAMSSHQRRCATSSIHMPEASTGSVA